MEKPQFDGKAIDGLRELVEHHEQKQQHSQQPSSDAAKDAAKGPGRANASEEAKSVL
jgi:hypothetical protein